MAEYNPKRQKTATDDQDRFQEVSICFNLPQQKENNVKEEEFKEASVPLKAMKLSALLDHPLVLQLQVKVTR